MLKKLVFLLPVIFLLIPVFFSLAQSGPDPLDAFNVPLGGTPLDPGTIPASGPQITPDQNNQIVPVSNTAAPEVSNSDPQVSNTVVQIENPIKGYNTLAQFLNAMVTFLLFLGIPISVFFIIYAGFLFVIAQGNEEKLKSAKNALVWALIGVAVLLGARIIATAIENTIRSIQP